MNTAELWDGDTRQAVALVEARLPHDVRAALANVKVWTDPACPHYADAGDLDIRVRPGLRGSTAALVGVLIHELGHLAGNHYKRLAAGLISPEAAEQEADRYARAWGFADELEQRRLYYGR